MRWRGLNIVGYIAIGLVALVLWPQRFGGSMTYDITHGISMQPTFHTGDLAVLRTSRSYNVGDVAAYRSPTLHTTVMHRIKTKTAAGYTFKGDNNNFVDPDTVTDRAMVGKLLFRVPNVGKYLAWLVKPINAVLLVGAVFLLLSDRRGQKVSSQSPMLPSGYVISPLPSTSVQPTKPLVVRIKTLRLPGELPTVELEDARDLEKLAVMHGIAILRDRDADVLLQGGMLFRVERAHELGGRSGKRSVIVGRRPSPRGRDWDYGTAPAGDIIELDSRRPA